MKVMKKLICCILILFTVFALTFSAGAVSNGSDAIIAALRSGVMVNGTLVTLPDSYINQAENYLAAHQLDDTQVQFILSEINAAKEAIKEAGVTDLRQMDPSTKKKVLAAAQQATKEASLKLTVGTDKKVKVVNETGGLVFSDENPIKTTGAALNLTPVFIVGAVLLSLFIASVLLIGRYGLLKRGDR